MLLTRCGAALIQRASGAPEALQKGVQGEAIATVTQRKTSPSASAVEPRKGLIRPRTGRIVDSSEGGTAMKAASILTLLACAVGLSAQAPQRGAATFSIVGPDGKAATGAGEHRIYTSVFEHRNGRCGAGRHNSRAIPRLQQFQSGHRVVCGEVRTVTVELARHRHAPNSPDAVTIRAGSRPRSSAPPCA